MNFMISVIIPIYNMEKYLECCLESVLNQTLQEIEVICVDDGSTDRTQGILESYAQRYSNIKAFRQERGGAGKARNLGLQYAKGKFIAFMDPDDFYPEKDVLEYLLNNALAHKVNVSGGNMLIYKENSYFDWGRSKFEREEAVYSSEYQFCYGYTRFIYSNQLLRENNILFPDYSRNQDPIFMLRALTCADKMYVSPKAVYVARGVDKKPKYNSRRVICDVANGIYDIIHFSIQHEYKDLVNRTATEELGKWKVWFCVHILMGNQCLYNVLKKINAELLEVNYIDAKDLYLNMTLAEIKSDTKNYIERINTYVSIMEKYKGVIIYGAGKIGKSVFDLIEMQEKIKFDGFAVSTSNPIGRARGQEICDIKCFVDKKEEDLLIIATKMSSEMKRNALELGFRNLLIIEEEVIDVMNFKIIDDKFAV